MKFYVILQDLNEKRRKALSFHGKCDLLIGTIEADSEHEASEKLGLEKKHVGYGKGDDQNHCYSHHLFHDVEIELEVRSLGVVLPDEFHALRIVFSNKQEMINIIKNTIRTRNEAFHALD